ncbi:hypothetical protein FS837_009165 [Tulasnella sp. UAMH 9824]|nr:hypothetical protein FS837_009165 [Tulasnella sp. UAMH 9824]
MPNAPTAELVSDRTHTIPPLECTFDDFPTSLTVYDPPSAQGAPPSSHNNAPEAGPSSSQDPNASRFERLEARLNSLEALMRSSLTGGNGFGHPKAPPLGGIRSPSVAEYYTPASLVPQTPVPGEHLPGPSTSSSSFYRGEHPSPYRSDYNTYRSESSFRPSEHYRRGPDGDIEMGRHDDSRYAAPASSSSSSFPSYTPSLPPPLPPSSGRDHISITHQGSSLGITTTTRIESPVPYNHPTPTVTNSSSGNDTSSSSPPPFVGTALTESASYMPMALCGPSEFANSSITVGRDLGLPASGVAEVLPDLPVLHPLWPIYLPPPALLNHLVDTFFACVPHAGKLLHRAKFLASLQQSPDSPDFPLPALLHAICALASIYTSVIDGPRLPPIDDIQLEEHFSTEWKQIRPNQSFGETHAAWASQECVKAMDTPGTMIQVMQAFIVLTWYQYTTGSSVNVWIFNGRTCRMASALGLLSAEGYGSLDQPKSSPFVVHPPRDAIEREERRNIAWLMYASERLSAAQTSWVQLLDDADISQFLPLSEADFAAGRDYPVEIRQRLASPNSLFSHPPLLTSPFSLLIKAVNLLSRVKAFNIRFRNKYADDLPSSTSPMDPRSTSDFQELDELIERFKVSWPKEFKDGGVKEDGKVDPTLYLVAMLPSVATILLHDPHADMASHDCVSARKIQEAVGSIMESIYKITSTSFDILLLDHYSSFCWFLAGAALIRILKAKMAAGAVVDVIKINSEIEIIRHILLRLSEKTLIGRRQVKLLNDHYDREIGIQRAAIEEATPSPITSAPSESANSVTSGRSKLRVSELLNFTSTSVPEVRPPNVGAIFDPSPSRSME